MNHIPSRIYEPSEIVKYVTNCCALAQLSLNNDHTLNEIKGVIDEMKSEYKNEMTIGQRMNFGTHERAVFVITLEYEEPLVKNLVELGFREIAKFHRRICYPQDELLTVWLLDW